MLKLLLNSMAKTKLTARAAYNRRKEQFQRANQRRPSAKVPRKPNNRMLVKDIEGRTRNKDIKIKQLILQSRNIEVQKNGQVIRRVVVRRKTVYPPRCENAEY